MKLWAVICGGELVMVSTFYIECSGGYEKCGTDIKIILLVGNSPDLILQLRNHYRCDASIPSDWRKKGLLKSVFP